MTPSDAIPSDAERIAQAASAWVLRLDRGLSAAEQDDYTQWLAADPRHREALAEQRWGWDELDRLAGIQDSVHAVPDPDLLRPRRRPLGRWRLPAALAAAGLALAAVAWWPRGLAPGEAASPAVPAPSYALAAPIEERALEDGSVVALNRGASVELAFTAAERRVRLVRGEANFTVAKNPRRPFIVEANGVDVRAVGTVFNVRLDPKAVEVVVSEGKVTVGDTAIAASVAPGRVAVAPVAVAAGERTLVSLEDAAPAPAVTRLDDAELERRLAWQPRLLDFTDQPLASIVAEFNRRNPVRLVLADGSLATMRLSASFRSDNVEGFVRLMESDFGMHAEWRGETEIRLRAR